MTVMIRTPDGDVIVHSDVDPSSYDIFNGTIRIRCNGKRYLTHLSNVVLIMDEKEAELDE